MNTGIKIYSAETSCAGASCHGTGLMGGNTDGYSCFACHGPCWTFYSTHNSSLFGVRHHSDVCSSDHFVTECGDSYCHGPAPGGSSSYIRSPACNACHVMPLANGIDNCIISSSHLSSKNGTLHHTDVRTDLNTCKTAECHGLNYKGCTTGTFSASACITCHADSSTNVRNCWIAPTHTRSCDGVLHNNSTNTTISADSTCHGASLNGWNTGPIPGRSCYRSGCHV